MFCPECGEVVEEGTVFCPNCGYRFDNTDESEAAQGPTKEQPARRSPLIPILVIAAVIIGLGAGIGLYVAKDKKAEKKTEAQEKKKAEEKEKKEKEKKEKEEKEEKEKKQEINPFEDLKVTFAGENGSGKCEVVFPTEDGPVTDYFFSWENDGKLSNGDMVVILYDKEKQEKYYPEYEVTKTSQKYAVAGLTEPKKEQPAPNYNAGVPSDLATSDSLNGYILYYSDSKYYDREYLETLTDRQLRFARNEIFARWGRQFNDAQLQDYFFTRDWYYPDYTPEEFDAYSGQMLNQYEKANVKLMKEIEDSR